MPVVRRPTAWRPGILDLAVRACGVRGRTGRGRTVRQRTTRMPGVLGRAARRCGRGRRRMGRARKVRQHASRMPEVPGPTARRTGVQGRPGRTAGDPGRRTDRARKARQRPARRAADRGQGKAGGPAAPGTHAVLGRGGPCRNEAEGRARRGHLLLGYAVRVRGGPGRLVRARKGRRLVAPRRAGRTCLATRTCRGPRWTVLGRGGRARLAARAGRGPGRARWGRGREMALTRGVLACGVLASAPLVRRGPERERGGRVRLAVLRRRGPARPGVRAFGGRRWAGRGRDARAGGQAAVRRRPGPGARAVPLMAFPQQ
jgi:hypothetical protein